MSDTVFRTTSVTEPAPQAKDNSKPNNQGVEYSEPDIEPVEFKGDEIVLEALGLGDAFRDLPEDAKEDTREIKLYVMEIMESKGLEKTFRSFRETLEGVKEEIGLDKNTAPDVVIERIGGLIKAYKGLSFINNVDERKKMFMKLAMQNSVKDMDRIVFEEAERRKVWQ